MVPALMPQPLTAADHSAANHLDSLHHPIKSAGMGVAQVLLHLLLHLIRGQRWRKPLRAGEGSPGLPTLHLRLGVPTAGIGDEHPGGVVRPEHPVVEYEGWQTGCQTPEKASISVHWSQPDLNFQKASMKVRLGCVVMPAERNFS